MTKKEELGLQFLCDTFNLIKKQQIIEGFAITWLEEIIELSCLNNFETLMSEALKLRVSIANIGNPLSGAITNIKNRNVINSYIWPKDLSFLEKKYSYDKVVEFLESCWSTNPASLYVSNINYLNNVLQKAENDFELETVACSLCINGYFDEASLILENELKQFDYRIYLVKSVMCIEMFRRNEFDRAKMILDEIYPEKNECWGNLYFAKGILGHEPWGGYPFSDY